MRTLLGAIAVLVAAAAAWWLLGSGPSAPEPPRVATPVRAFETAATDARALPEPREEPTAADAAPVAPSFLLPDEPGARWVPCGGLRGRVVDAAGTPVPGVRVELAEDPEGPWTTGTERVLGRLATDPEGRFAIEALPADRELSLVLARGLQRSWLTGLSVPADAALDVGDLLLPAAAGLSGLVTDEAGAPLRGVEVLLGDVPALREGISLLFDPTSDTDLGSLPARLAVARAVTGEEGRFLLDGVQPGPAVLHFAVPGRASLLAFVQPDAGERHERTYRMEGGVSVAGRVRTREGAAVPGAQVMFADERDDDRESWYAWARTNGDGRFRLDGVPPAPPDVEAIAPGFRLLHVSPDEPASGAAELDIVMRPLRALRATVLLPDGSPAPRFALDLLPLFEGFLGNFLDRPSRWRRETHGAAARGEALLRPPSERRFIVLASGPDGLLAAPLWFDAEEEAPDQEHTFQLAAPRVLRGRVTDAASGEGLPGASVRVLLNDSPDSDPDGPTLTDAEGRFTVEAPTGVSLGLHASAAGHVDLTRGAPEGRDDDIVLALGRAGSLRVLVAPDAEGRQQPCEVQLSAVFGELDRTAELVQGTCIFPRLPPGRYEVSVAKPDFGDHDDEPREGEVEVLEGRQAVIEL